MKSTQLLKLLINLFYYGTLISFVLMIGFLIYSGVFGSEGGIMVNSDTGKMMLSDNFKTTLTQKDFGKIALMIAGSVFFFTTIYHLRSATLKMIKGEMFDEYVVRSLKWAGVSIVLYKVFQLVDEVYTQISYQDSFSIGLDFGYGSFAFTLMLGLFFILLSKVIQNGITLKMENDLTI